MLIAVVTSILLRTYTGNLFLMSRAGRVVILMLSCFLFYIMALLGQVTDCVFLFALATRKLKTKSLANFLELSAVGVISVLLSFTFVF